MKNRIQELRKQNKIRQEDLAEAVGVTRQTIISLENGKYNASLQLAYKISRYFFVSKFYLCRAFKARFGISVHEYITTKRIMLSRQLISAGETASAAAYKVGFGDYSSFYRAYRKVVGEVPARLNQRRDSK